MLSLIYNQTLKYQHLKSLSQLICRKIKRAEDKNCHRSKQPVTKMEASRQYLGLLDAPSATVYCKWNTVVPASLLSGHCPSHLAWSAGCPVLWMLAKNYSHVVKPAIKLCKFMTLHAADNFNLDTIKWNITKIIGFICCHYLGDW